VLEGGASGVKGLGGACTSLWCWGGVPRNADPTAHKTCAPQRGLKTNMRHHTPLPSLPPPHNPQGQAAGRNRDRAGRQHRQCAVGGGQGQGALQGRPQQLLLDVHDAAGGGGGVCGDDGVHQADGDGGDHGAAGAAEGRAGVRGGGKGRGCVQSGSCIVLHFLRGWALRLRSGSGWG